MRKLIRIPVRCRKWPNSCARMEASSRWVSPATSGRPNVRTSRPPNKPPSLFSKPAEAFKKQENLIRRGVGAPVSRHTSATRAWRRAFVSGPSASGGIRSALREKIGLSISPTTANPATTGVQENAICMKTGGRLRSSGHCQIGTKYWVTNR